MPRRQRDHHLSAKLTLAQRRAAAGLVPALAPRLRLDEPNQRVIAVTPAELKKRLFRF